MKGITCILAIVWFITTSHFPKVKCNSEPIRYNLVTGKKQYWNAKYGYSWCIHNNHAVEEYIVDSNKRYHVDRGDVIINSLKWRIKLDSLFFEVGDKLYGQYIIISLTSDSLIVRDLYKSWGWDTLVFYKSNNRSQILKTR